MPLAGHVIAQNKVPVQSSPPARPQVAEDVKAWQGEEGVEVWILRYGPREENKALVQITNIDHPWNQRIQIMDVQNDEKKKTYSLMVNGNRFVSLKMYGMGSGELYLPNEKQSYRINYSQSLSSYGNAQHFLTDYLNQKK
ncbi:hypothetical protein COO59_03905 [Mixta theicola]|uniref:Uncharacterized protein n=2 Tax=Mixta theicola TaxID=1458355 RepID=A0A2K1QDZ0_9GAMM|nr:hypothetical protein COO59_03905 [Mixta theicola]